MVRDSNSVDPSSVKQLRVVSEATCEALRIKIWQILDLARSCKRILVIARKA